MGLADEEGQRDRPRRSWASRSPAVTRRRPRRTCAPAVGIETTPVENPAYGDGLSKRSYRRGSSAPRRALRPTRPGRLATKRGKACPCLTRQQGTQTLFNKCCLGHPGVRLLDLRQECFVHVECHTNCMHP